MGNRTNISWTDSTWNFLRGCSRVSKGCMNCYAERMSNRFNGPGEPYEGLAEDGKWTGEVRVVDEHFGNPLRWSRPRMIFVNSMSDTFHENVSDETLIRAFKVMREANRHVYQVLTKRPERMASFTRNVLPEVFGPDWLEGFPHVWFGTSVEDQETMDARGPHLLNTPGYVRFLSVEPMLAPIRPMLRLDAEGRDVTDLPGLWDSGDSRIHWVIVGAESGPGARPMKESWVRDIKDLCVYYGVRFFYKQDAQNGKKIETPLLDGKRWTEMPADIEDSFTKSTPRTSAQESLSFKDRS